MKVKRFGVATLIIGLSIIVLLSGCSSDNLSGTANSVTSPDSDASVVYSVGNGPLKINAQIKTTDQNQLQLTFEGTNDVAVAMQNCEIVRYNNEMDSPIPFVDITPGEMAMVWGKAEQNGYINAYCIKLYGEDCPLYDVAFRDTIATIDYSGGTFTVNGRDETIAIDENTVISTRVGGVHNQYHDMQATSNQYQTGSAGKVMGAQDVILEFSDLQVGYEVEVRANIIDENNLLAVIIKVPHSNYKECIQFGAYLASVDAENRTVTFDDLAWNGLVCQNAILIGLDGETLTLEDFAAGEYVTVKGFALEGDELKICRMEKAEFEG